MQKAINTLAPVIPAELPAMIIRLMACRTKNTIAAMSPSEAEVTRAKRILEAMEKAAAEGKGAVSLDGRLIDYASIRQAEVLVQKAKQIAGA